MKTILALLIPIVILISCENPVPNSPSSLANITADISGVINTEYSGSGRVTNSIIKGYLVLNLGTSTNVGEEKHMLGIFLFFKDNLEKTGKFPFVESDTVVSTDCAIGSFSVWSGGTKKKEYISESGIVEITKIEGTVVKGTFWFKAKNASGEQIEVKNGTISFY
ncbi:MAG: hypothetical protein N2517_05255 [Ignavibacteria bacterium]|nr:hypothetical protein [Ignavibacteria bacterium]